MVDGGWILQRFFHSNNHDRSLTLVASVVNNALLSYPVQLFYSVFHPLFICTFLRDFSNVFHTCSVLFLIGMSAVHS